MRIKSPLQKKQILATLHMDFIRHDHTRSCTAIGESGTLKWDGVQNSVNLYDSKAKEWVTLFRDNPTRETSYIGLWQNLSSAIKENLPISITLADGLRTLNIIESAKIASKNGGKVKVFYNKKI
jgi:predicted dehydrogenase